MISQTMNSNPINATIPPPLLRERYRRRLIAFAS
jgi:hypothetical protein